VDPIRTTVASLELGPPVTGELLTLHPLLAPLPAEATYDLARDAFGRETLEVTEVSEGGSVPTLTVINHGERPVLLLDGEELIGAKQNRVLNVTVLVPAHQTIAVPVSCVEAGRWHYRSRAFRDADWLMNREGRARKMRRVRDTLKHGSRAGDQADVWDHVAAKASRLDAASPTGAQEAIFARHHARLEEELTRFRAGPRQVGVVVVCGARIAGIELLDAPETFARVLAKLVLSHAVDALDTLQPRRGHGNADVREFVRAVGELHAEWYPAVGLGREARLRGPGLTGAALVAEDRLVHLSVLEDPESVPGRHAARHAARD
jgi:hypothetical protein